MKKKKKILNDLFQNVSEKWKITLGRAPPPPKYLSIPFSKKIFKFTQVRRDKTQGGGGGKLVSILKVSVPRAGVQVSRLPAAGEGRRPCKIYHRRISRVL